MKSEQILAKVMQWAAESDFEARSISDTNHDFVVEVSEAVNLPTMQIVHQKADTAFVLAVGLVNIPETDRNKLKKLGPERFNDLMWSIKIDLLHADVDFTVLGREEDPDAWEVQRRLYLDGTDVSDFHEACSRVKNSLIGIIWSYKKALASFALGEAASETDELTTSGSGETIDGGADRTRRVMNAITNTSVVLMSALMGGFTKAMMETTGAVASEMAGAMGGEEAREEVDRNIEEGLPEAEGGIKAMISEVRGDMYAQLAQKRDEIESLISHPVFDLGPEMIDGYDFHIPRMTEELDDDALTRYTQLLVSEDPDFVEMFKKLTEWINSLPKLPDKSPEE